MLFHGAGVDNSEDILFSKFFEYFSSGFLAVKKNLARVIGAHNNDTKVRRVKVDVNVE
jgi:hypothetical protein